MKDASTKDLSDFTPQIYNSYFGSTTNFNDLTVEVAGFPLTGKAFLFQHVGCIKAVADQKNDGRVVYYDVDMTGG